MTPTTAAWVPVAAEMPPEYRKVLVGTRYRDGLRGVEVASWETLHDLDEDGELDRKTPARPVWLTVDDLRFADGVVTHWAPLPEPPG